MLLHEGQYFRQPRLARVVGPKNAISDDPLYEPLRKIGVDEAGIRRFLKSHGRGLVQRWVHITEAAMHEKPRGFAGFKASPAAYLIDGVQESRTPPDWFHAHEKRQEQKQWQRDQHSTGENGELKKTYDQERQLAFDGFLKSVEGRARYDEALIYYEAFYKATEPERYFVAAHEATVARIERIDFKFPCYEEWSLGR